MSAIRAGKDARALTAMLDGVYAATEEPVEKPSTIEALATMSTQKKGLWHLLH